jgi:iron complex transport system ATP-binding protein
MMTGLCAESVSFGYRARPEQRWVFDAVTLRVDPGDILVLLGPNGTGKSTLLKCLAGLLWPQAGRVVLDGVPLRTLGPARVARRIGYVAQSAFSTFPFSVLDVVVMGRAPHLNALASPSRDDVEIARAMMAEAGIEHLADRSCHEISAGEWQMVLLARALAQQPDVLLLDEPTSHLDIANQVRVLGTIRRLARQGFAVVLASHAPDHAFMAGGRVAILKDRHLMACGPADEVITSDTLREAYGVEVRVAPHEVGRLVCAAVIDEHTADISRAAGPHVTGA